MPHSFTTLLNRKKAGAVKSFRYGSLTAIRATHSKSPPDPNPTATAHGYHLQADIQSALPVACLGQKTSLPQKQSSSSHLASLGSSRSCSNAPCAMRSCLKMPTPDFNGTYTLIDKQICMQLKKQNAMMDCIFMDSLCQKCSDLIQVRCTSYTLANISMQLQKQNIIHGTTTLITINMQQKNKYHPRYNHLYCILIDPQDCRPSHL